MTAHKHVWCYSHVEVGVEMHTCENDEHAWYVRNNIACSITTPQIFITDRLTWLHVISRGITCRSVRLLASTCKCQKLGIGNQRIHDHPAHSIQALLRQSYVLWPIWIYTNAIERLWAHLGETHEGDATAAKSTITVNHTLRAQCYLKTEATLLTCTLMISYVLPLKRYMVVDPQCMQLIIANFVTKVRKVGLRQNEGSDEQLSILLG
jgi:hypothetical protein